MWPLRLAVEPLHRLGLQLAKLSTLVTRVLPPCHPARSVSKLVKSKVEAGSAFSACGFAAAPNERRLADLAPTMREIAHLPRDTDRAAGAPLFELFAAL